MSPIRIGFIGLSKPTTGGSLPVRGAWAQIAHLPGILAQPDVYQITALCNSSIEAAKASIAGHKLPAATKAYDDPTALANDPNVDLVVVSVFIGEHYKLAKPALEAGKMVWVEAPLAASVTKAEELAKLAKEKGVRTLVSTQGRGSAAVAKVRELLAQGEIGEVVSSNTTARMAGYASSQKLPVEAAFVFDLEAPGNSLLIGFNHFYDTHVQVLGPHETYSAQLANKALPKSLVDSTGTVVKTLQPTSPDHIFLQGTLASSALFSISFRPNLKPLDATKLSFDDPEGVDDSYLRWIITGTKGEIEITTPDVMWQMAGSSAKVWLTKNGKTEQVPVEKEFEGLGFVAANTAAQYKAFVEGNRERFADFEQAANAARFMEELRGMARAQARK